MSLTGYEVTKNGFVIGHIWGDDSFTFHPDISGRRPSKKDWPTPEASLPRWAKNAQIRQMTKTENGYE